MGRAMKLSDNQVMKHLDDWTAPFEIVDRAVGFPDHADVVKTLRSLRRRGLAEWSRANNTYRLTDSGRALLTPGAREETTEPRKPPARHP
jgi:hypothetical protein